MSFIFFAQEPHDLPLDGPMNQRMLGHIRTRNVTDYEHGTRKHIVRLGTINLSTLKEKEEEIVMMMKERNIDILGLCETRLPGEGTKLLHDDYQLFYSGGRNTKHGVGVIVSDKLARKIGHVYYKSERIISFSLKIGTQKISFIQVYAPQQGRPQEEKDEFYIKLQETKESVPYTENIIIMGDLNGHVGIDRAGIENILGAFSIGDRNREGESIIDFCLQNQMSIMNTFYTHQESQKWTWYRWNSMRGQYTDKSMIDLALTNNKNLFRDVKSVPSVSLDSDHRLLLIKLKLSKPKQIKAERRTRFCLENLQDPEYQERYKTEIRNKWHTQAEAYSSNEKWLGIQNGLKDTATNIIETKTVGNKLKKQTPWWNDEMKECVKKKMRLFRKWMKTRRIEDHENYKEASRQTEIRKRLSKEQSWKNIGEDLRNDLGGTKKLIYKIAKSYRKGSHPPTYAIKDQIDGTLLTDTREIELGWKNYFESLLNVSNVDLGDAVVLEFHTEESTEPDISVRELEEALKRMKNGKASGVDQIPAELLKNMGETGNIWLLELFDMLWNGQDIPEDWSKDLICPVYKKGDKTECSNYRGISLMSHTFKVYERILEKRLRRYAEPKLGEWQSGFRPGRGTSDMIFTMKIIFEKSWEWKEDKYIAFLDLEKAFDRVPRQKMWDALNDEYYEIPEKLKRAIYNTYKDTKCRVKTANENEDWFEVKTGVRQGSVLSPLLFIMFLDKCMREKIDDAERIIDLLYADDHVIIANSIEDLQNSLEDWNDILTTNGMKISKEKSEVMLLSRVHEEVEISLEGHVLQQSRNFKYLGVTVSDTNDTRLEVIHRITKFNNNLRLLYPLLKDRNTPKGVKTLIYTSILRPILAYGHESWTLTSKTRSQIQAAEMKVLRLIKGVTRLDKLRNENIRRELHVEDILEFVERGQLRWYGHVKRMDDSRYPRKYLEWKPDGRRPVGRPRKRWLENIDASLRKRGSTLLEIERERLFDDRQRWRELLRQGD